MKRIAALLTLALVAGCDPQIAGPSARAKGSSRYRLVTTVEERQGIRLWYLSTYRLLERDASGTERELWREERPREKYASHIVSPEGTVWVVTESVPGPGASGQVWMRRRGDGAAWATGTGFLLPPKPVTVGGHTAMTYGGHASPPDLSRATATRLRSGAEELRFENDPGRETRFTWLDATGRSQRGEGPIARWTVREGAKGAVDPWAVALANASAVPNDAELLADPRYPFAPIRFWRSPRGVLALHAASGWGWEWPVRLRSVEPLRSAPASFLGHGGGFLWWQLDRGRAPELRLLDVSGRMTKRFDLRRAGFPDAESLRRGVRIDDPRLPNAIGERRLRGIDPQREYVPPSELHYPMSDGGRLALILGGANAPRLERRGPAETVGRLLRKEREVAPGARILEERSVRSPSGEFRLRTRRWSHGEVKGEPRGRAVGYVTLLGWRRIAGRRVEIEMFAYSFDGDPPVEARVFDDGRVAILEHREADVALLIWDAKGQQICGLAMTQDGWPDAAIAKREFRIARMPYRTDGTPMTRLVEGVRVREWSGSSWRLPLPNGRTRVLRFERGGNSLSGVMVYSGI